MGKITTWRKLLKIALQQVKESFKDIIEITLTDEELDAEFNDGFGGEEGRSFTAWTQERVYFPACYDGSEWAASVPRNPCKTAMRHVGGG